MAKKKVEVKEKVGDLDRGPSGSQGAPRIEDHLQELADRGRPPDADEQS